jgi:hypothetical protein
VVARVREDRLLRWTAYASIPALWFSIALLNPLLLVVPPLTWLALRHAMRRGWIEREDPVEDPDLF